MALHLEGLGSIPGLIESVCVEFARFHCAWWFSFPSPKANWSAQIALGSVNECVFPARVYATLYLKFPGRGSGLPAILYRIGSIEDDEDGGKK